VWKLKRTDRLPDPNQGEDVWSESDYSGRVKIYTAIIIASMMLSLILISVEINLMADSPEDSPTRSTVLVYTPHAPISIKGDIGFAGPNASTGIVRGSGTDPDPYIIEKWEINASLKNGIEVRYANVSFIIQDCLIYEGTGSTNAIHLYHCTNGIVKNNSCCNNSNNAVYVERSVGVSVANNTCWDDYWAIRMYFSNNSDISNNTCYDNVNGIFLLSSNNNMISYNNLTNSSWYAMNINGCLGTMLSNNKMINGGIAIWGENKDNYCCQKIDTSNTANGKPIYYYANQTGVTVPIGAGQILIANCTNMIIEYQNLSEAGIGIEIAYCSGVSVSNSTCSNEYIGIVLKEANNNEIEDCMCLSNSRSGIDVYGSDNNRLLRNNCSWNQYGIFLFSYSGNNEVNSSTCQGNSVGIFLSTYSHTNRIINNTCIENDRGIHVFASDYAVVQGNTCTDSVAYGIYLDQSINATVSSNSMINNGMLITGNPIPQYNSHSIDTSNTVNGKPLRYYTNQEGFVVPSGAGQVILANCKNSTVEDQELTNASVGIELAYCTNITASHLNCSNNYWGVYLYTSSKNFVTDNTCSNDFMGIQMAYSNENTISNNNCSGNSRGVSLLSSNLNDICANGISNSSEYGIYFGFASNNNIFENRIENNMKYGVNIFSGFNNRIWNNSFANNNGATSAFSLLHIQAYDAGVNSKWNSSSGFGNFWNDWTTPDNVAPFGIVDLPYNISGGANSKDYFPLTTFTLPIPEFNDIIIPIVFLITTGLILRRSKR
jgi:parallel beta-helix repeat protein